MQSFPLSWSTFQHNDQRLFCSVDVTSRHIAAVRVRSLWRFKVQVPCSCANDVEPASTSTNEWDGTCRAIWSSCWMLVGWTTFCRFCRTNAGDRMFQRYVCENHRRRWTITTAVGDGGRDHLRISQSLTPGRLPLGTRDNSSAVSQ